VISQRRKNSYLLSWRRDPSLLLLLSSTILISRTCPKYGCFPSGLNPFYPLGKGTSLITTTYRGHWGDISFWASVSVSAKDLNDSCSRCNCFPSGLTPQTVIQRGFTTLRPLGSIRLLFVRMLSAKSRSNGTRLN